MTLCNNLLSKVDKFIAGRGKGKKIIGTVGIRYLLLRLSSGFNPVARWVQHRGITTAASPIGSKVRAWRRTIHAESVLLRTVFAGGALPVPQEAAQGDADGQGGICCRPGAHAYLLGTKLYEHRWTARSGC